MSASVATHMAGLPNFDYSSDNMPDFTATQFPDHMELDRSAELDNNHNNHNHNFSESSTQSHAQTNTHDGDNVINSKEHTEALGNLLGALIPNQGEQSGDLTNFSVLDNGFPDAQAHFATNDQIPSIDQAAYDQSRLPSFDATAGVNELFSNTDFTQLDTITMDIPHTPNGQHVLDMNMSQYRRDSYASQTSASKLPITPKAAEYDAFARLQFEDGSYYMTTFKCELGRDVLAYKAALQREQEEKEELYATGRSRSSSGRVSHMSIRARQQIGSQVQPSVVSEAGGFAGIDDASMQAPPNPAKANMSSQESESSVVTPAEYLIHKRNMPFDYNQAEVLANRTTEDEQQAEIPDNEQPAAVTSDHMPNPNTCPLIPIHGSVAGKTDADAHRSISRRHVRIYWSFTTNRWEMRVQGINGAWRDDEFHPRGSVVPLEDGTVIQIAHIPLTFRLPKTAEQKQQEDVQQSESSHTIDADEALPSVEPRASVSVAGDDQRESPLENRSAPKISLKLTQKVDSTPINLPLGPDGLPIQKRRGPGRPPKDGVMSTRERKEREKAAKLAQAREANGGRTPPASMRPKFVKPELPVVEETNTELKPSKRKYTKRKSFDENGNPVLDDGDEEEGGEAASDGEPKSKKTRAQREKSESPEYPPKESLSAEQLARPSESYAQLLYKILLDLYPRALPLKDIYRELKKRHPWYVYEAVTEGWQSSVRHNLNSEFGKLFDKGDKEGKGFAWRAIPDAQLPQTEKKRTVQAPVQRPRPPPPRQQFQPLPGQNVQWQGTGTFPPNGQQPFINHGPWAQQGQPNGNWQPNGAPPNGVIPQPAANGINGIGQVPSAQQPVSANTTGSMQTGPPGQPALPRSSQPPSSTPQPVAIAASNMPCTLAGVEAIKRFQSEMWKQLKVDNMPVDKQEFWAGVFASSKKQALHGAQGSTHAKGESREEATILWHMNKFVTAFANPAFEGFTRRSTQPSSVQPNGPPPGGSEVPPSQRPAAVSGEILRQSPPLAGPVSSTAPAVPVTPVVTLAATSNSEVAAQYTEDPGIRIAAGEATDTTVPVSQPVQGPTSIAAPVAAAVTAAPTTNGEQSVPDSTQ